MLPVLTGHGLAMCPSGFLMQKFGGHQFCFLASGLIACQGFVLVVCVMILGYVMWPHVWETRPRLFLVRSVCGQD